MKWFFRGLLVLFLSCAPVAAQQTAYVYTALGYQQLAVAGTAVVLTIPAATRVAEICIETNSIRYRDDGVAPTSSVGMLITAGSCFQYSGPLPALQFIQVTSSATVDASYYR